MSDPRQPQFWSEAENELWDELDAILQETYLSGVDGGVGILPKNIQPLVNFDHINSNALTFARNYRYTWVKGINDTTRKQTQQAIADWIQSGASLDALDTALEPIFGANRAAMIAATEVTRAFAQGNLDAWESTGVVEGGTWMTTNDERVCPICSEHDGETVGIGDIDAAPPDASHPGCRCWLKPVVSEELVHKRLEEIIFS